MRGMGMQVGCAVHQHTSYRLIKKEVVMQSRRFHRLSRFRKNKRLLRERLRQRIFSETGGADDGNRYYWYFWGCCGPYGTADGVGGNAGRIRHVRELLRSIL